jgi:hypothetical protein
MASRRNVPAATVREWASTPEGSKALTDAGAKFPGERGRLDPTTIAVFAKENPRLRYETGVAEAPTFTVPVVTLDKNGRKTTVKREVTNAEARAALGQVSKNAQGKVVMQRGRMNHGLLSLALSAAEADRLADSFA